MPPISYSKHAHNIVTDYHICLMQIGLSFFDKIQKLFRYMIGSRALVGSSNKIVSGSQKAQSPLKSNLFLIPPESSEGILSPKRETLLWLIFDNSFDFLFFYFFVCSLKGKATLS